ncbi:BolA family protein [Stella sp.]|uniref:BolA family protein n=1 Tax=Stella sp. TaxID=2912054 RepID=UPI0035AE3114
MTMQDTIRDKLTHAFRPIALTVEDDSHRHAGHAGARPGGETHYRVDIVATDFAGRSRVERQRMVYAVLAAELAGGVHALQLRTRAPGEPS